MSLYCARNYFESSIFSNSFSPLVKLFPSVLHVYSGHRFVGYIEEEACHTYTKIITAIETAPVGSELAAWKNEEAPAIAKAYWKLGKSGTVLNLVYAVRADEAEHRDVNHACSDLPELDSGKAVNPFNDPDTKVKGLLRKYIEDIMDRSSNRNNGSSNKVKEKLVS